MYAVGLDIGGTKCAVILGLLDKEKTGDIEIIEKQSFPTAGLTPTEVIDKFCDYIDKWNKKFVIGGIGIACGSPLDPYKGIIQAPPNLPTWDNVKIVDILKERFNIPAYLQNDANACAVAEWKFGAGKGYSNMVFLTFGTGFGAGLVLDNRLYFGTNCNAGEIGHVRLTNGGPVGYYKKGSAEGYCSGGGIEKLAIIESEKLIKKGVVKNISELMDIKDGVSAKTISIQAREGNAFCKKIMNISGRALGKVLSILIDLLNPEIIVIGGVFMRANDLLLPPALKVIKKETLSFSRKVCKIVPAGLGEKVGDYSALSLSKGDYGL